VQEAKFPVNKMSDESKLYLQWGRKLQTLVFNGTYPNFSEKLKRKILFFRASKFEVLISVTKQNQQQSLLQNIQNSLQFPLGVRFWRSHRKKGKVN